MLNPSAFTSSKISQSISSQMFHASLLAAHIWCGVQTIGNEKSWRVASCCLSDDLKLNITINEAVQLSISPQSVMYYCQTCLHDDKARFSTWFLSQATVLSYDFQTWLVNQWSWVSLYIQHNTVHSLSMIKLGNLVSMKVLDPTPEWMILCVFAVTT